MGDGTSRWRRAAPVAVLLVLAPVCVDVVFGATRLGTAFALVPEVLTYGVAAVLIRDAVRAGRRPTASVLLLGACFAIVSECLVVQTSLAPGGGYDVGRALGVNWPYLVWAVGYEAVWAIALPVRLTEALFPDRAGEPWLGPRGRLLACAVFLAGCGYAWAHWTRLVRPLFLGLAVYDPPWPTLLVAAAVALAVGLLGWWARPGAVDGGRGGARAPRRWTAAATGLLGTALWFGLTVAAPGWLPPAVGILAAAGLAGGLAVLLGRWSRGPGWSDGHALALVAGALAGSSLAGFVVNHGFGAADLLAKVVVDLLVLALVGQAARRSRAAGRVSARAGG